MWSSRGDAVHVLVFHVTPCKYIKSAREFIKNYISPIFLKFEGGDTYYQEKQKEAPFFSHMGRHSPPLRGRHFYLIWGAALHPQGGRHFYPTKRERRRFTKKKDEVLTFQEEAPFAKLKNRALPSKLTKRGVIPQSQEEAPFFIGCEG